LAEGVILNLIDQVDVNALGIGVINQGNNVFVACVDGVAEIGGNRGEEVAVYRSLEKCAEHVFLGNAGSVGDNYLIGGYDSWRGLNWLIGPGDGL